MQLLVPFLLACFFVFQRQLPGAAFCAFFFFENFLIIRAGHGLAGNVQRGGVVGLEGDGQE